MRLCFSWDLLHQPAQHCCPGSANGAWLSPGTLLKCPQDRKEACGFYTEWAPVSVQVSDTYIHLSLSHHTVLTQCLLQAFLSSLSFCFLVGWLFFFFGQSVGWWYFLRLLATQVRKIPASQYLENNNYGSVLSRVIQGYGSTSQTTH